MSESTSEELGEAYHALVARLRERAVLASCITLLCWDEETCMPAGGAEHRAEQLALLAGLDHERLVEPRLAELIDSARAEQPAGEAPESVRAATLRDAGRLVEHARLMPRTLVEAIARETTLAQEVWQQAHRTRCFADFAPSLARVVALKREEAACLHPHGDSYDALLDHFEPGATAAQVQTMFDVLCPALQTLLAEVGERDAAAADPFAQQFDLDRQRAFGQELVLALGLDPARARLDEATHPSSMLIGPGDCRITTRYHRHALMDGIYAILHELGHAFYDLGLPSAHWGSAAGETRSLGLHESQSPVLENHSGRSRPFLRFLLPRPQAAFEPLLDRVDLDAAYAAVNRVQPTLVRVEADEVTYNLHIAIRFQLERALIGGDLEVSELPGAWSDAYATTLGIRPRDDRDGCLQDGHWAAGLFGYFPTYTLGNLVAAQLDARMREELPDLDTQIAAGDLSDLLAWLGQAVHRWAARLPVAELVTRATAIPLGPESFLAYLDTKYRR